MSALPFDPQRLSPEDRALYDRLVARRREHGAPFDGPYAALMNHPQLCARVEELGFYLKFEGHLAREVYQFVVLAVAKETGAAFEWDDHVEHARAAGVPPEVIDALAEHGMRATFPPPYALAAQILAHTLPWQSIPAEVQTAAITAYGLHGFLEIVTLSGFYQMFSAINQGFDIRHDSPAR